MEETIVMEQVERKLLWKYEMEKVIWRKIKDHLK
jgi:hypothetical protein